MENNEMKFKNFNGEYFKNPPSIDDIQAEISNIRPYNDDEIDIVDNAINILEGKPKFKVVKNKSKVVIKLAQIQAEWIYADIEEPFLVQEKLFSVNPPTANGYNVSKEHEIILDKNFTIDINKTRLMNDISRAFVDEGTAILKVGWKSESIIKKMLVEKEVFGTIEEVKAIVGGMLNRQEITDDDAISIIQNYETFPIGTEEVYEDVEVVTSNHPTLEVVDYNNIFFDPSCSGKIEDSKIIVEKFSTSLSELRADGSYETIEQNKEEILENTVLSDPDFMKTFEKDYNFDFDDDNKKRIVAYRSWIHWDINGTGIAEPIIVTSIGDMILKVEENPFPGFSNPFSIAQCVVRKGHIRGKSQSTLLEDSQDIVGAVNRGMIDTVSNIASGQKGIRANVLSPLNQIKFERGENYKFEEHVANPADLVYIHKYPELPASAMQLSNIHQAYAESISGSKSFSGGLNGDALGSTATGVRSTVDAMSKRKLSLVRRVASALSDAGRKIMKMNSAWMSDEEILAITDLEETQIKNHDSNGEFDVNIDIFSSEVNEIKSRRLSFMLQTIGSNMDPDQRNMIISEIAKLDNMHRLSKSILEPKEPQVDPLLQKEAELRVQILEAELETEKQKALELGSEADLNKANAEYHRSRARHYETIADNGDLEFIEKELDIPLARKIKEDDNKTLNKIAINESANSLKESVDSNNTLDVDNYMDGDMEDLQTTLQNTFGMMDDTEPKGLVGL